MNEPQTYQYNECLDASVDYFGGDELAASTFLNKYALYNSNDELTEDTPEAMHRRMATVEVRLVINFISYAGSYYCTPNSYSMIITRDVHRMKRKMKTTRIQKVWIIQWAWAFFRMVRVES